MLPTPAASHATYARTEIFSSLDGLRFLCIAAVLWHHSPLMSAWDLTLSSRGHLGVHMFFVLSGFLITTLLLREMRGTGQINLLAFYWRRALRILPVYILVVAVAVFYDVVIKGNTQSLSLLPYYLTFLSNYLNVPDIPFLAPTWSLAVEEQYYLLWPLLLVVLPFRWIGAVLFGLIAVNVAAACGMWQVFGARPIDLGPLRLALLIPTFAPILMGSLLALVLHQRRGFDVVFRIAGFHGAAVFWSAALVLACAVLPRHLEGAHNLLLHVLMCLMLASLVVREDNALAPVLRLRPVARIGQISYGIYLYHLFTHAIVFKLFAEMGWTQLGWIFPLNFVLSILVAEVSFRTYEAWFMRWRRSGLGRLDLRQTPKLEPQIA